MQRPKEDSKEARLRERKLRGGKYGEFAPVELSFRWTSVGGSVLESLRLANEWCSLKTGAELLLAWQVRS